MSESNKLPEDWFKGEDKEWVPENGDGNVSEHSSDPDFFVPYAGPKETEVIEINPARSAAQEKFQEALSDGAPFEFYQGDEDLEQDPDFWEEVEFLLGDIAIKNHEMLTEELKKLQPRVTAMINDKDYSQSTRIAKELGHVLQGVSGEGKVENELDAIVEDEEARQRDTEQERQDEEDEVLAA